MIENKVDECFIVLVQLEGIGKYYDYYNNLENIKYWVVIK